MIIIPAVDLHQGKCVRLTQGKLDQETVISTDPAFIARLWQARGAKRLHLVDLDGAYCGGVQHWDIIKRIRTELSIPIEFGGGVRSLRTVEKLDELGIDRIIISTVLISNPPEGRKIIKTFGRRIMVAVDVYDGKIAIGGWKDQTSVAALEFIAQVRDLGVEEIILTDINREGMLTGVNLDTISGIVEQAKMKVIISGGVTTLDDIRRVATLAPQGVTGLIIGKALYAEKFTFDEAVRAAAAGADTEGS